MIDVDTPQSPGWWLRRLSKALDDRNRGAGWSRDRAVNPEGTRPGLALLADYHRGESPLPQCAKGWHQNTRGLVRKTRTNYARLVVSSAGQRMQATGWRTAADDDRNGDQEVARVARTNELDVVLPEAINHMLEYGDGYLWLGRPRAGSDVPSITVESPRDVITAHDPVTRETVAALKRYRDEWTGEWWSHVILPGHAWVTRSSRASFARSQEWDEARSGPLPGLAGRVPVRRLRNTGGVAEIEPHLDLLDRISEQTLDRMSIAKIQAFRQRAIRGLPLVYPEGHPRAGEVIVYDPDAFLADPGALWTLPEGAEIWESTPIDLGPIRLAARDDVEALVAVTGTPLHYIQPDAASGSAEGAATMRETLVFRVEDRLRAAQVGIQGILADAFAAMGDTARADASAIRTIWMPIERHSLTEKWTAALAAKNAGMPLGAILTDVVGYAPDDLARVERERGRDLLFADAQTDTSAVQGA